MEEKVKEQIQEEKKFKLKIFTDSNLAYTLSKGWDIDQLISGKVRTLTARTFEIECTLNTTIKELKNFIEDQEGYNRKDQTLKKGTKTLDDPKKTLGELWVNEKTTLHLITPSTMKKEKNSSGSKKGGLKTKMSGGHSKVMVITEDDAKKLPNVDYFEDPENFLYSGPQTKKKSEDPNTPTTPKSSTPVDFKPFSEEGKKLSNESKPSSETPEERRILMLKALENRQKK